jgi:hypothetical protein
VKEQVGESSQSAQPGSLGKVERASEPITSRTHPQNASFRQIEVCEALDAC